MIKFVRRFSAGHTVDALAQLGRAVSYFAEDRHSICLLVILTVFSTAIGLLQAWPLAVMIDSLIATTPANDWLHRLFLAPLPDPPLLQVAGLAAIALALRLLQELLTTARKLLRTRIEYKGVLRVRCDLFRKMQALHLGYHQSAAGGRLDFPFDLRHLWLRTGPRRFAQHCVRAGNLAVYSRHPVRAQRHAHNDRAIGGGAADLGQSALWTAA